MNKLFSLQLSLVFSTCFVSGSMVHCCMFPISSPPLGSGLFAYFEAFPGHHYCSVTHCVRSCFHFISFTENQLCKGDLLLQTQGKLPLLWRFSYLATEETEVEVFRSLKAAQEIRKLFKNSSSNMRSLNFIGVTEVGT